MTYRLHLLCLIALLLLCSGVTSAQTTLPSQFTGTTSEWLTYDGQQRPTGRLTSQATSLTSNAAGTRVVLRQQFFDATDIPLLAQELPVRIAAGGPVRLDVRALISPQLLRVLQLKNLKLEADSLAILPMTTARPGDLLPETSLTLGDKEGPTPRGIDITSVGRWIEDRETVTTPAGTFNCLRLNQNLTINTFTAGVRRTYEARVVAWYAPETGLVRLATYVGTKLLDTTVLNRTLPTPGPATAKVGQ